MDQAKIKTREELMQMDEEQLRNEFNQLQKTLEKLSVEKARKIGEFHNILADPRQRIKVPRNAPCPCGSGKKFKFCCMQFERKI